MLLARYTHGPGVDDPLLLERDLDASGGFDAAERFFYQTDGLGSVTELTESTGAVARALVYDAYGQVTQDTGGIAQPYAFTGRERDAESGLYFYRARYYDPATGRFLSNDPLGFGAGDANLYRYVFNSPVNLTDPDGRIGVFGGCALGAGIGGFGAFTGVALAQLLPLIPEIIEAQNTTNEQSDGSDASQTQCGNPAPKPREPLQPPVESLEDFLNTPLGQVLKTAGEGAVLGCLAGFGFPVASQALKRTVGELATDLFLGEVGLGLSLPFVSE